MTDLERPQWSAPQRRCAGLLLLLGAALRLFQYAVDRSLWLDEAALARNIILRPAAELVTRPLDHIQTAPPGFLLLEKLAATFFGHSEYALRLVPLLLGLLSLPLFLAVARRVLPPAATLVALAMFAFSGRLVYYASEVKQYGPDVFVALLLLWLTLRAREHGMPGSAVALLAVVGAAAPWVSQPALFVLPAAGLALLRSTTGRRDGRTPRRVLMLGAVWGVASFAALVAARRSLTPFEHEYMRSFWSEAGFVPLHTFTATARWPLETIVRLARDPFGSPFPPAPFAAIALGAVWLRRRDRGALLLLGVPFLLVLAATVFRVYPLGTDVAGFTKIGPARGRLLLFLLPAAFIVAAAGVCWLRERGGVRRRVVAPLLGALLVVPPLYYSVAELPRRPEDVRPLLERVAEDASPGDLLWVFYGAGQQFRYYELRGGVPPLETVVGRCERPYWRRYLTQMDSLAGRRRVWLLFSHPASVNGLHEGALLRGYLDRRAHRLAEHGGKEAYLLLYDFGSTPATHPEAAAARAASPPRKLALAERCVGVFEPGPQAQRSGGVSSGFR